MAIKKEFACDLRKPASCGFKKVTDGTAYCLAANADIQLTMCPYRYSFTQWRPKK